MSIRKGAIVAGGILIVVFVIWGFGAVQADTHQTVQFTVQSGWGTGRIATELHRAGLIRWAPSIVIYGNLTRTGDHLQAGTYLLSPGMTPAQIVRMMAAGQVIPTDIEVTVPEGTNVWDLDRILSASGLHFRLGQFSSRYRTREGYLFPETYRFAKDATPAAVDEKMEQEFRDRAASFTAAQVITASILEKEAKTLSDREIIAGIIAKRLAAHMPLQIDATVAYGWCLRTVLPSTDCDVTQVPVALAIHTDGPYNTYTRTGLPAGPIANPGLQALGAAAHPVDSPYLYYLSTRDGSQIIYAKTLQEQEQNRRKYLGL